MSFSPALLRERLAAMLPPDAAGLLVALSGGGDSAALLAALVEGSVPGRSLPLRAVHVNHGLQPFAHAMQRACETFCGRLGVPLSVLPVEVDAADGASLEAAAREARYAAFAGELKNNECLLTAHHAEDQAETLLLQLLRGAGLKGLAGMPACRPWRAGWHLRPLLSVARNDLRAFGEAAGVLTVRDPMNEDLRFDRAYVRARIWPLVVNRWPGAAKVLARSAQHLAEAQSLLDQVGEAAWRRIADGEALIIGGLRQLSGPESRNAVRHWLTTRAIKPPPTAQLNEGLRQVLSAEGDHAPAILWNGHALRRYRDRLFVTAASPPRIDAVLDWCRHATPALELGAHLGTLRFVPARGGLDPARLPDTLVVRGRRGGESLKPNARGRTQTVQHLCQRWGVLPWMRDALPFIYAGESLVGVGDLWCDSRWCVAADEAGLKCLWQGAPRLG